MATDITYFFVYRRKFEIVKRRKKIINIFLRLYYLFKKDAEIHIEYLLSLPKISENAKEGSARRSVIMKNLKVSLKFIVSFGTILVLFLISIGTASLGISRAKASYKEFYTTDYKVISSIYEIRLNQRKGLYEMMLGVMSDGQEAKEHVGNVDQYMSAIESDLQWIHANYTEDLSALKEFETQLQNTMQLQNEIAEYAVMGTEEATQQARKIFLEEYNPQVESCISCLVDAFNQMESVSAKNYEDSVKMQNMLTAVAVGVAAVAFIITCIIGLKLTGYILVPVKKFEESIDQIVKGNLSTRVDYDSQDEFGAMAISMGKMTSSVAAIIKDIETVLSAMAAGDFTIHSTDQGLYVGDYETIFHSMKKIRDSFNATLHTLNQSANQVSNGSDQVSSGAQALSQGATEQASSVEELAASINEISNNINQNAEGAKEASNKSALVGEEVGESNRRMHDMLDAMAKINASSGEIGKIIKTIEDIAFQTNILALNAAVEAARAGAAGKGFAVVADEVRNLASKSAEASKNTAVLIENSLNAVENGKKIADETAKSLESVMSGVSEAAGMMDSIAKASQEQADAITQITLGIDQISSVVQTNSATAEQSAAASEELSSQAQLLKELVHKFRLDGEPSASVQSYSAPDNSAGYSEYAEPESSQNVYYGSNDKY